MTQQSTMVRIGGWLFGQRTWLPLPLILALFLVKVGEAPASRLLVASGVTVIGLGEALRLWAVQHIGAISRTRSDRLGPVVSTGPFASVRNPLYIGNLALWIGFALTARLLWLAPIFLIVLGLEYHAIVRWEETLLESRRGDDYRLYAARVPRWIPSLTPRQAGDGTRAFYSWRETLFSERGTLIAIAAGLALLWLKSRW